MANSSPEKGSFKMSERRLWIGNLDSKFREFQLLKMVEKFGSLVEFDYLYHRSGPQSGQPRGYAFITYKELEAALKAMKTLDGIKINGRSLAVKWAHLQDESKFEPKKKPVPAGLSIKGNPSFRKSSNENKIAALEAKLKTLENKDLSVDVAPDMGGPSRPTSVSYNYIERKNNYYSRPYRQKSQPYWNTHKQQSNRK